MRLIVAALAAVLALGGCVITNGPDCSEACDSVLACKALDKTFFLSCSSLGSGCGTQEQACAECIALKTCDQLIAGECDLVPDGGSLCLVP